MILIPQSSHRSNSPKFFAKYTTYQEATGVLSDISEIVETLSRLTFPRVMRTLATLSNALSYPSPDSIAQQSSLVHMFIAPTLREKITRAIPQSEATYTFVFHRQQLLLILRLALLACPREERQEWNEADLYAFGEACLKASDLLGPRLGIGKQTVLTPENEWEVIASFLPLAVLSEDGDVYYQVPRGWQLWHEIPVRLKADKGMEIIDFNARFQEQYNVEISVFYRIVSLLALWMVNFDMADEASRSHLFIRPSSFIRETSIPQADFDAALAILAEDARSFGWRILNEPCHSMTVDFTLFRGRPLLWIGEDELACYDRRLLINFCTEGMYWLIHKALSKSEQDQFKTDFGKIYAEYVESILYRIYGRPSPILANLFQPGLKFQNTNDEFCDGLIDYDQSAIVMEFKSSSLTPHAKYSGDATALKHDVETKFVKTQGGKQKGVTQLGKSINRIVRGEKLNSAGFDIKRVRVILPALVVYDPAITAPLIRRNLDSHLKKTVGSLPEGSPRIAPLVVLTTRDIEAMEALSQKHKLGELIEAYIRDRDEGTTFWNYVTSRFQQDMRSDRSLVTTSFDALYDTIVKTWFHPSSNAVEAGTVQT